MYDRGFQCCQHRVLERATLAGVAVPAGSTFSVLGSGAQTADVELQIQRSTGAAVSSGQDAGNLSSAFTIGVRQLFFLSFFGLALDPFLTPCWSFTSPHAPCAVLLPSTLRMSHDESAQPLDDACCTRRNRS